MATFTKNIVMIVKINLFMMVPLFILISSFLAMRMDLGRFTIKAAYGKLALILTLEAL